MFVKPFTNSGFVDLSVGKFAGKKGRVLTCTRVSWATVAQKSHLSTHARQ